jgi:hypothetical protein
MPQFQVFSINDPFKVVGITEAGSHEEARAKARLINRDYTAVPLRSRGAQAREAGVRAVQLREDSQGQAYTFAVKNAPDTTVTILAESREAARARLDALKGEAYLF